jgi:two-component system phosphate regulon sensor histidine kinase PhoR
MTSRRKLLWKLFPFYLLLFLVTASGIFWVARNSRQTARTNPESAWLTTPVAATGFLMGALIASLGFIAIYRISRSIEVTREGARRFAEGDLQYRLPIPPSEELAGLAQTLNQMAAQLDERITTINRQRNEEEAILGSMVEGVIAVNPDTSIRQINPAAAALIGAQAGNMMGRALSEVIRNRELHALVESTFDRGEPVEGEIVLHGKEERFLQTHCTPLRNEAGAGIGALVVFNDITHLRRLERVRRDFVANVSHELKTPLTSIKGFVETLMEGALDQPEEAMRFCQIISKQVDRLQAIIEDLLSLSRIEQEVEQENIELKPGCLLDILHAATHSVALHAQDKNISIEVEGSPEAVARINAPLLEQVAVNLLDNAIKYSDHGKKVALSIVPAEHQWELRFADQGFGIESMHLKRIFERFYRVDKARSRKAGGTGLGLAIVKHIVTAHGGHIQVASQPGVGSVFTVYLPR